MHFFRFDLDGAKPDENTFRHYRNRLTEIGTLAAPMQAFEQHLADRHFHLVAAPGAGIADDKAIYCFVPEMIRFYLGEEPVLENVPTWRCAEPDDLKYVLEHLPELVVKDVHGSGGYGMLVGPKSTKEECETYAARIRENPAEFIAQPTLELSTAPTLQNGNLAGRHVDFRPFCLVGQEVRLVPGGLTRVALKEGSLVVNSSQGGGTKDTWVLED